MLGLAGLFLPFLQGFLFLIIGSILVSQESPFMKRQKEKLEKRYPVLFEKIRHYRKKKIKAAES